MHSFYVQPSTFLPMLMITCIVLKYKDESVNISRACFLDLMYVYHFSSIQKNNFNAVLSSFFLKDINECNSTSLNNCNSETETCENTEGSFACNCKPGFRKAGSICQGRKLSI